MKVFQNTETLPVLLMNYFQSREQKWYRVKHSIFTHFPKDRNCDICLRTKITRASCRRRTGTVVPRAEHFGDLITADHKFLSEGCESRHNHRYAVVVQNLATQWVQAYPCKTKTSQETRKSSYRSSWSWQGNQKSFTLTILWNLARLARNYPGIIGRQHRTVRKLMGLLREQCAELRKDICGTVAIRSERRMVGGFHGMLLL